MDGDGWGTTIARHPPRSGWALEGGDCDDDDPQVSPGQSTDYCDGQDTDCDGDIDEDSKAGWSLLTIETCIGSVLEIDTTSGATSQVTPISTDEQINTMDVSENGTGPATRCPRSHVRRLHWYLDRSWCPRHRRGRGRHRVRPERALFGIGGDELYEFDSPPGRLGDRPPRHRCGHKWSRLGLHHPDHVRRRRQDRVFEIDLTTGAATNVQRTSVPFSAVGLEFDRAAACSSIHRNRVHD